MTSCLLSFLCMGESSTTSDKEPKKSGATVAIPQDSEIAAEETDRSIHDISVGTDGAMIPTPQLKRQLSALRPNTMERVASIPEEHPLQLMVDADSPTQHPPGASSSTQSPFVLHSTEPPWFETSRVRPRSNATLNDAVPGVESPANSPINSTRSNRLLHSNNSSRRHSSGIALHEISASHGITDSRQASLQREGSISHIHIKPHPSLTCSLGGGGGGGEGGLQRQRSVNHGKMAARLASSRSMSLVLGLGLPPSQEKPKRSTRGPVSSPAAASERPKSVVLGRPATDLKFLMDDDDDDEGDSGANVGSRSTMDGTES